MHKQYSLDRAAAKLTYAFLTKEETQNGNFYAKQAVGDFLWKFQKFKVKKDGKVAQISPLVTKRETQFYKLVKKRPEIKVSDFRKIQDLSFGEDATHDVKVKMSGSADMIELLLGFGFEELKDLVIDEPED